MAQARPKNVSKDLFELPNSKWEYIIDNFIKSEIDRKIAKLYYLKGWTQVDVGAEVAGAYPNNILLITMNGHITCSKYGIIYDSFDCRERVAEYCWKVK